MDLPTLVQHTVENLSPALPFLVEISHGAAKKIGENTIGKASELASKLWESIRPKAQTDRPALIEAAKDVAADPEDKDAQGALRLHVRKLLEVHPNLQIELQNILGTVAIQQNTATASGTGAIAVGGNVSNSDFSTNAQR